MTLMHLHHHPPSPPSPSVNKAKIGLKKIDIYLLKGNTPFWSQYNFSSSEEMEEKDQ